MCRRTAVTDLYSIMSNYELTGYKVQPWHAPTQHPVVFTKYIIGVMQFKNLTNSEKHINSDTSVYIT